MIRSGSRPTLAVRLSLALLCTLAAMAGTTPESSAQPRERAGAQLLTEESSIVQEGLPAGGVAAGDLLADVLAQVPCTSPGTVVLTPRGGTAVSGNVNTAPSGAGTMVTATINGLLPGMRPTVSILTTVGTQQVVGPPAGTAPVGGAVVVSGTVAGVPVQGSTVTVSAQNPLGGNIQVVAQGPLQCGNLPPVPPVPPLPPLPPPQLPPPLLPLPPPPPALAPVPLAVPVAPHAPLPLAAPAAAGAPMVPIIPEADSLLLLAGGLGALGALVALRRLRRRDG